MKVSNNLQMQQFYYDGTNHFICPSLKVCKAAAVNDQVRSIRKVVGVGAVAPPCQPLAPALRGQPWPQNSGSKKEGGKKEPSPPVQSACQKASPTLDANFLLHRSSLPTLITSADRFKAEELDLFPGCNFFFSFAVPHSHYNSQTMSASVGEAGAKPTASSTGPKPLGMRKNGTLSQADHTSLATVSVSNMLIFPRQTMARAKEGFPPWLGAYILRETSKGEGRTGGDEGQGKRDEGREGGRETGATNMDSGSNQISRRDLADKLVHRDG